MKTSKAKWVLGHKVTAHETTGNYDLLMGETPAKVPGPPPHLHQNYKEVFLVVEGEMDFMVDGKPMKVSAGESIDIPPHTLHTFGNNSDKTCKWVNIHSPKGFRDFFESLGVEETESDAQQKSVAPEAIQKVMQTAEDFDMIIKL